MKNPSPAFCSSRQLTRCLFIPLQQKNKRRSVNRRDGSKVIVCQTDKHHFFGSVPCTTLQSVCVRVDCEHRHNIADAGLIYSCVNVVHKYLSIFIDVCSYEFQSCPCIIFFTRQMIIKGNPCLDPLTSCSAWLFVFELLKNSMHLILH